MKKSCFILLLLSGCGSPEVEQNAAEAELANALLANLATAAPADDTARLQALIARALPAALPDAKNALYRNVRSGAGGAACGEVASKPRGSASALFRPFVITPDAVAVVGASPKVAFGDPSDFLADAYIRWCATPEELQRISPELQQAANSSVLGGNEAAPAGTDSLGLDAVPPVPAERRAEPPAKPSPAPPRPAPAPEIDSFFNSVQRDRQ